MISNADAAAPAMLTDFLAFTLAGTRPNAAAACGRCASGVRFEWWEEGIVQLAPPVSGRVSACVEEAPLPSVLVSAGVHGDETAPVELLSRIVADLARGALPLACRLLIVLGNTEALRGARRYLDDDLNRLFCGRHPPLSDSREAARAAVLEAASSRFFDAASTRELAPRWHLDMHTAIRASVFEQFALLPHTGEPLSRAMFEWLAQARIAAVLLHTAHGRTFTQYTADTAGATSCTLELGEVRPFGENDLSRFAAANSAVRALISGVCLHDDAPMPRVFTVVDQITKKSEAFELLLAPDVPNFTALAKGTLLARDGPYRYAVAHDDARIVFPNQGVKPGLRAGLMVVETTREALAALAVGAVTR